jgi:AmmeMemoRadiSam system protein B
MFYPGQAEPLHTEVCHYLNTGRHTPASKQARRPKALIAPHAGHVYSGPVAASAYKLLFPFRQQIRRVLLLGPSHRVPLYGMALPTQDYFATPLGDIPLDTPTIARLATLPGVQFLDAAHAVEHSLEVHLPFLQEVLPDFSLIPIVVGDCAPEQVAALIQQLWDDDSTLILISSDLSHFLDYQHARQIDRHTADRIVRLETNLHGEEACGCRPLNGLLQLAREKKLDCECLDLRNSYDTAGDRGGDKNRVVGYGSFALYEPSSPSP